MASIYLQLNTHKKNYNKLTTNTQETNITIEKIDDKTIQQQNVNNYKKYKKNYYLRRYENYFHKKLVIKYNVLPQEYNLIQLDNFITAKYCHDLASFKENLIYYDSEEFLKRYYKINESNIKIPIFSDFYKSYLNFFCFPTFAELKLNDFIEEMVENKAKAFYNENYQEEEDGKEGKNSQDKIDTIIFNPKVRLDISRKNTLTDLSKTTIKHNLSSKSSINSTNTINNILDILKSKINQNNITLKKTNKKNNLLKKENNNDSQTERIKFDINISKILLNDNSNCITDRNNKNNINKIKNINIKNYIKKGIKSEKNSKNNLIKLIKNKYIIRKISQKNNPIKNKINNSKKISQNNNIKEIKKLNLSNNLLKNVKNNKNSLENNNKNNNITSNKIKTNKKNASKKVIKINNKNLKHNTINDNNGHNTDRESKNYIPNINKINKNQKLHPFLKIALNFNKSSPKRKSIIFNKKMNSKDSKISLTDRNKSNKLKNKISLNSNINTNLTEYLKCYKKRAIKKFGNKYKKIQPISRNYKIGLEDIRTTIVKSSLRKNNIKDNIKNNFYSSSKKKLGVYNKFSLVTKNTYSKNKTQKILRTSKEVNFFKKEKSNLTTINLSNWQSKRRHLKMSNFKTINVKKSNLPLNKLIIMTMGLSNNNHTIKKQTTLNKINLPNL